MMIQNFHRTLHKLDAVIQRWSLSYVQAIRFTSRLSMPRRILRNLCQETVQPARKVPVRKTLWWGAM